MKLQQQRYFRQSSFRFKRWSRKGYAAFFSLKRAVTIGQLSSNVSERFQVKNGSNHSSVCIICRTYKYGRDRSRNGYLTRAIGHGSHHMAFSNVTSFILFADGKTDIGSGFVRTLYYIYIS